MCLHLDATGSNVEVKKPRPVEVNGLERIEASGYEGCDGGAEAQEEIGEADYV